MKSLKVSIQWASDMYPIHNSHYTLKSIMFSILCGFFHSLDLRNQFDIINRRHIINSFLQNTQRRKSLKLQSELGNPIWNPCLKYMLMLTWTPWVMSFTQYISSIIALDHVKLHWHFPVAIWIPLYEKVITRNLSDTIITWDSIRGPPLVAVHWSKS